MADPSQPHSGAASKNLSSSSAPFSKPYWSWGWLFKWFVPLPILVWFSLKYMGGGHVWYQNERYNLEIVPRLPWR